MDININLTYANGHNEVVTAKFSDLDIELRIPDYALIKVKAKQSKTELSLHAIYMDIEKYMKENDTEIENVIISTPTMNITTGGANPIYDYNFKTRLCVLIFRANDPEKVVIEDV